jgi:undecaprenyl-diphosphatase
LRVADGRAGPDTLDAVRRRELKAARRGTQYLRRDGSVIAFTVLAPIAVFAWLAHQAHEGTVGGWDKQFFQFLGRYEEPEPFSAAADHVINVTLEFGSDLFVAIAFVVIVGVLALETRTREIGFVLVSVAGVVLMTQIFQPTFDRTMTGTESRYEFPSGHAARSMLLVAVLAWLVSNPRSRVLVIAGGGVFITALGLALAYEHWHPPTDVVGGWAMALGWVGVVRLLLFSDLSRSTIAARGTQAIRGTKRHRRPQETDTLSEGSARQSPTSPRG